ncbi:unnamed protein product [Adineta ricciae]|uniref:Uncharacterized protein n=1 Tax=Adineta ricciae TaxID=249248 RepID=A0A815VVQ4_ADIRI|nr:unnamed protein product [Adineta ricciae]CAF1626097.1 unnamed protein product [Adineta ricciae]
MNQLLKFVCLIFFCSICEGSYRLYHTHIPITNNDHHCLYRFEKDSNELARFLVPYCIRSNKIYSKQECLGRKYSFYQLYLMNVTKQNLFDWFAPIDVIDDYSSYLRMEKTIESNEKIFCNCSDDFTFGEYCQYKFTNGNERSTFDEIVISTFEANKQDINSLYLLSAQSSLTCYDVFNCTTYTGICLDWREISDGYVHCTNGADEKYFIDMELNECDPKKEYRCRNGLCIPRNFIYDRTFDCPDWYDEAHAYQRYQSIHFSDICSSSSAITECEEYNVGLGYFPCGNGQRISTYYEQNPSCSNYRDAFMLKNLFQTYFNISRGDQCYMVMLCNFHILCLFEPCSNGLEKYCEELLSGYDINTCPEQFFYPPGPFVFPFVRLIYKARHLWDNIEPDFICWNSSICNIYDQTSNFIFHGFNCFSTSEYFPRFMFDNDLKNVFTTATRLFLVIQSLFSQCTHKQNESKLYRCSNQLSISIHRILDGHFSDCIPWSILTEDEYRSRDNYQLACNLPDRFQCGFYHCVSRYALQDGYGNCDSKLDEIYFVTCSDTFSCQYIREIDLSEEPWIRYQTFCNGYDMIKEAFGDRNNTDETDCEMWPCDAVYTHCDGYWNRINGCDELNCTYIQAVSCAHDEHPYAYLNLTTMRCLTLSKNGDGNFDCLFGTDERVTLLEKERYLIADNLTGELYPERSFKVPCWNDFNKTILTSQICDRTKDCILGDDELFCEWHLNSSCDQDDEFTCKNGTCISKTDQWCNGIIDCFPDGEDERLCDIMKPRRIYHTDSVTPYKYFLFDRFVLIEYRSKVIEYPVNCHRGIPIYNELEMMYECLCPPSYYGLQCERQSERLTIFYRIDIPPTFDRLSIYRLVLYLLDENHQVLSYETMTYTFSDNQFSLKQVLYLNYPRSINGYSEFKQKFVRINAYRVTNTAVDSTSLSWFYSVPFSSYLPVTRVVVLLYFEESLDNQMSVCRKFGTCHHGVCHIFINSNEPFCDCEAGWSGVRCDQKQSIDLCETYHCNSQVSKCISYNNHTFCLCFPGYYGPKCEISFDSCSSIQCENNGTCVSLDERTISQICVCPKNYFGTLCQYPSAQLILNIPSYMSYIPLLIIHFVHSPQSVHGVFIHQDFYFYRHVYPRNQLNVYDQSNSFLTPFIFAQIFLNSSSFYGTYYLISLSNQNRTNLTSEIKEIYRCPHINEFLNSTLSKEQWLKRVKYYHLFTKNTKCFHDEIYMCLVDKYGLPDCLIFNHNVANCSDRNICTNNGRCLRRQRLGQSHSFVCICPQCTAGDFCQIQMNEYSFTLDSILGQIILTDVPLKNQPIMIKILILILSFMLIIGFISNLCSFIVFSHKDVLKIGCGYYLLILSILNQISISMFISYTIYLLINQMTIIENKQFIKVSCLLFDFFIRIFLSYCDWIYTCISFERMISTVKGVKFNKILSIRMVKYVISIVFIGIILISIHNVFSHVLIIDPRSDDRLWCVIQYKQSWLRTYDILTGIFNNSVPFFLNLICSIILIVSLSKTRQRVAVKQSYRKTIILQFRQHKDLLIAPFMTISTKLPLLIASLAIKCINKQSHLYLILFAYYLSLAPLISTFIMFVLPSDSYMKIFKESLRHFRHWIMNN